MDDGQHQQQQPVARAAERKPGGRQAARLLPGAPSARWMITAPLAGRLAGGVSDGRLPLPLVAAAGALEAGDDDGSTASSSLAVPLPDSIRGASRKHSLANQAATCWLAVALLVASSADRTLPSS